MTQDRRKNILHPVDNTKVTDIIEMYNNIITLVYK